MGMVTNEVADDMSAVRNSDSEEIGRTIGLGNGGKGRRHWLRWLSGAVLMGLVVAGVLLWLGRDGHSTLQYRTADVRRGALTVTVTATGNLAPTNEVEVGSELSGIVQDVLVDFNATVTVGQPLARLDATKFEALVMQSRAALASARARHQQAKATLAQAEKGLTRLRRAHALTGGRAPSAGELEAAEADLERARADVAAALAAIDQAQANLRVDETNLAKTTIFSPIDGTVLQRNVDPGQTVAASLQAPVLFLLAEDLTRMELQVDVDEADVGRVEEGQSATFTVDAYPHRTFTAHITQVRYGSRITDGVVTYTTLLDVANPDRLLRPGMTATAQIVVEQVDDALLVPNSALRFSPPQAGAQADGRGVMGMIMPGPPRRRTGPPDVQTQPGTRQQQVWRMQDNQPVPVQVLTGPTDGIATVVTNGDLQPGTAVIVGTVLR